MTSVDEVQIWENLPEANNTEAVDFQSKWYTWGLIRAGDCTMFEGAKWTLTSNGDAYFDATVTSGNDKDAWIIKRVAVKDPNGAILAFLQNDDPPAGDWNKFVKNLPDSSQRYRWFARGYFDRGLFPLIASMQLQECSC